MIRLKPLLEIQLIKEALPVSAARDLVNIKRNPAIQSRLDNILDELAKQPGAKLSKRGDRVAIPFESDEPILVEPGKDISTELKAFYNALEAERKRANHTLHLQSRKTNETPKRFDELVGQGENVIKLVTTLPTDLYGRKIKMSKYISTMLAYEQKDIMEILTMMAKPNPETGERGLTQNLPNSGPTFKSLKQLEAEVKKNTQEKFDKLINMYNDIPELKIFRENKAKSYYMVFSKHAYDVGGMSTNRGWSSCMNLYGGVNKRYIQHDIEEGSFVVYLVAEDDLNITKPTARILIKPYVNYTNADDVYYQPEENVYGTAPRQFAVNVMDLIDRIQPGKSGTFKLIDTLYCDSKRTVTKFGDPNIAEKVKQLIQSKRQATTVDEAKYIMVNYMGLEWDEVDACKFEESDKLYVTFPADRSIGIYRGGNIKYCPINIKWCQSFFMADAESYEGFPIETNRLSLRYNTPAWSELHTKINNTLAIEEAPINGFDGLQPSMQSIRIFGGLQNKEKITSLAGIPASVDELAIFDIPLMDIDIDIDTFVQQLKPVGLQRLHLDLRIDLFKQYLIKDAPSYPGGDKFINSLFKKLQEIPVYEHPGGITADEMAPVTRAMWKLLRFKGWLSRQLPTLNEFLTNQDRQSMDSLPNEAFPENW